MVAVWYFLAGSMLVNDPVIYTIINHQVEGQSYFPLFVQITVIILGLYALTTSSFLTVLVTVALGYAAEHISAILVQIVMIGVYRNDADLAFAFSPMRRLFAFIIYAVIGGLLWDIIGRKTYVRDEVIRDRKAWVGASILILCFVIFSSHIASTVILEYSEGSADKGTRLRGVQ